MPIVQESLLVHPVKHTAVAVERICSQPQSALGREDPDLVAEEKKSDLYLSHSCVRPS